MTTTTKERPIIFTAPMVLAILRGQKTVTRRILNVPNHPAVADWVLDSECRATARAHSEEVARQYVTTFPHGRVRCPYGQPGDRLWVREAWVGLKYVDARNCQRTEVMYKADFHAEHQLPDVESDARFDRWRSPIHMPRWASRITLEVVKVGTERLHEMTEQEAILEGV